MKLIDCKLCFMLLVSLFALPAFGQSEEAAPLPYTGGPFKPSWESLADYQVPDWFRDAKFGIWAHWSAQSAPDNGDWYARWMYVEGHDRAKQHRERYGHPSEFGFKDVINSWKAENLDAEHLMDLYQRAGAKYFVMLANHHENFDNWNSKHHEWNSVNVGPKKDLVSLFSKAARKRGLHYGLSVHSARAWSWYEVSQMSDTEGPLAGVPYDGKITKAEGVGKWWEGLDPQKLYVQNHRPHDDPVHSKHGRAGDPPSRAYGENFYARMRDLIAQHKPDLLYFDDHVLPLRHVEGKSSPEIGLGIAADLYNTSIKQHGKNEAVMNTKGLAGDQRRAMVLDIEKGVQRGLDPIPWQTDTCIGNWHYLPWNYRGNAYRTPQQVVHMLVDIVSKNGNLLLSIPMRGDGTIDSKEVLFLLGMEDWTTINGAAIYGTRPWKIFGEGPSAVEIGESGEFGGAKDVRQKPYTAEDLRFTTKDGTLYAILMAWPEAGEATIRCLGKSASGIVGEVTRVQLLGHEGNLEFERTDTGLVVSLPEKAPCEHAYCLKLEGLELEACEPEIPGIAVIGK